jgi:alkylated DNA repair dioxygenase AlkB
MSKLCKFYIKNCCNKGNECRFLHSKPESTILNNEKVVINNETISTNEIAQKKISTVTENRRDKYIKQNKEKKIQLKNDNKLRKVIKKNTETFEPCYLPPAAYIVLALPNKKYSAKDIIIAPNLFEDHLEIYRKLKEETINVEMKSWHGDTHLIANDHKDWKKTSPTFNLVIAKIAEYFNMDIKATRFNLYQDSSMWKCYHHDAAAIDPKKAEKQNMTIGVSFGATRSIGFEHAKTKTKIFIPLESGMTYGFGKDVNIEWRHGIPPIHESQSDRISIIAWGWCE